MTTRPSKLRKLSANMRPATVLEQIKAIVSPLDGSPSPKRFRERSASFMEAGDISIFSIDGGKTWWALDWGL